MAPRRFLLLVTIGCLAVLALAALARHSVPAGFFPADYGIWRAKLDMVGHCDLAPTVVLGDSRVVAGINPRWTGMQVSNLALTGGSTVEVYGMARQLFACSRKPKRIVVSLIFNHFMNDQLFWPYAASFGLFDRHDLEALRRQSRRLGDPVLFPTAKGLDRNGLDKDGLDLGGRLLVQEYGLHFPTSYVANLIEGAVMRRFSSNCALEAQTLSSNGYVPIAVGPGFGGISRDVLMPQFRPTPILDHYFRAFLELAQANGTKVVFINTPLNKASFARLTPAVQAGFAGYLGGLAADYPNFTVSMPLFQQWPDADFGDEEMHLNPAGARRFSGMLAGLLKRANVGDPAPAAAIPATTP